MQKDENNRRNIRLLELYNRLMQGEALQKRQIAAQYQISEKTIQRDIECLRSFMAKQNAVLVYKRSGNCYTLESHGDSSDTTADMVVQIGRILCATELAEETERSRMLEWLLAQLPPKERVSVILRIQAAMEAAEKQKSTVEG